MAATAVALLFASAAQAQTTKRGASAHQATALPRLVGAGNLPGRLLPLSGMGSVVVAAVWDQS